MTFTENLLTQDLLDLKVGTRSDSFRFELVDQTRVHIADLPVSEDATPNVSVDTSRTSMRLLNNLEIVTGPVVPLPGPQPFDIHDLDIFRHRVRAFQVMQSGLEFPLGVFMFGTQNRQPHLWGDRFTPQLFDEGFILNQRLSHTRSIPTGGSILDAYLTLVIAIGIVDYDVAGVADVAAGAPIAYQVGSLRYEALSAMAHLLGCFPPYFSNTGTLKLRPIPDASNVNVDHTYTLGTRIFEDTTTVTSDAYTAPNRWIAVGGSPKENIVGIYDLPDTSPASYAATGRRVTADIVNVQGISNTGQANTAARRAALTDKRVFDKATFQSASDPRHDIFDTVELLGVRYLETAWQIDCVSGGVMTHNLSKLYG